MKGKTISMLLTLAVMGWGSQSLAAEDAGAAAPEVVQTQADANAPAALAVESTENGKAKESEAKEGEAKEGEAKEGEAKEGEAKEGEGNQDEVSRGADGPSVGDTTAKPEEAAVDAEKLFAKEMGTMLDFHNDMEVLPSIASASEKFRQDAIALQNLKQQTEEATAQRQKEIAEATAKRDAELAEWNKREAERVALVAATIKSDEDGLKEAEKQYQELSISHLKASSEVMDAEAKKALEEKQKLEKQERLDNIASLKKKIADTRDAEKEAANKAKEESARIAKEREAELDKIRTTYQARMDAQQKSFDDERRNAMNSEEVRSYLQHLRKILASNNYVQVGPDGLPAAFYCYTEDCCPKHNLCGLHLVKAEWKAVCPEDENKPVRRSLFRRR